MNKKIAITLTLLIALQLVSGLAHADGMLLPELTSPDYLIVKYHHVTVEINENHAVTRVKQAFHNPNPFPVSSDYLFPVPPDAALTSFQATVGGQQQPVIHQDAAATNVALYEALRQRRDPTLLQYVDWETVAFTLDLPAGGVQEMELEYEQLLAPTGGLYRYRYILSTERYSAAPLEEVSVTVHLASAAGLASLYSSTHLVEIERLSDQAARVSWSAAQARPDQDFELFYSPAEGGFGAGLLTGRRESLDHLLFLFAPQLEPPQDHAFPKDLILVIDRSGSMSGEKIVQARNALHFILGQLNPGDRFSIVGFDDQLSVFNPTLRPAGAEALADARRFVDALVANGSTDLEAALQTGVNILARSEARPEAARMIVFLTDGLPTAGVTDPGFIAQLVTEANDAVGARLHVFGVGYDVNTHLLDRLAAENGGAVTYVQPGEDLEVVLTEFYGAIAQPLLTDIEVEFEGIEASDLYPARVPDLFVGSSLLLAGRYHPLSDHVTVRVRGLVAGRALSFEYRFDLGEDEHDFVPRLWATRRLGDLLDQVRVEGESQALVEEIRALGLNYGLVTPYTTFVIQAQGDGAASAANMQLYANQSELNAASGQTTIQARVQNQAYQAADQASLAVGANVLNNGRYSLAQVGAQNVDLALVLQLPTGSLNEPITADWIERTIEVDRTVEFGSDEYLELAADPTLRPLLQSGVNVLFEYQGEVIAVQDSTTPANPGDGQVEPQGDGVAWQAALLALFQIVVNAVRTWFRW